MPADQRAVWEGKAAADEERYQKELADNQIEDGLSKEGEDGDGDNDNVDTEMADASGETSTLNHETELPENLV
jgi:hypothetical protein